MVLIMQEIDISAFSTSGQIMLYVVSSALKRSQIFAAVIRRAILILHNLLAWELSCCGSYRPGRICYDAILSEHNLRFA
jgi:hypothetical protein